MNKILKNMLIPVSTISVLPMALAISCGSSDNQLAMEDVEQVRAESLSNYVDKYGEDDGTGKKVMKPFDMNDLVDLNIPPYDDDKNPEWYKMWRSWFAQDGGWANGLPLFSLGQASSIFLNVAKKWGFNPTYSTNVPVFKVDSDKDKVYETIDQNRTDKFQKLYDDLKSYDQVVPAAKDLIKTNWLLDMGEDGAFDYSVASRTGVYFDKSWITDNNDILNAYHKQFDPSRNDHREEATRVSWSGINWDISSTWNSDSYLGGGKFEKLYFGESKDDRPAIVNYSSYLDVDHPGSLNVKLKFKMKFEPAMSTGEESYQLFDKTTDKPMKDVIDKTNPAFWNSDSAYFLDKVLTVPGIAPQYPLISEHSDIERYSSLLMAIIDQVKVLYDNDPELQKDFHAGVVGGTGEGMPMFLDFNKFFIDNNFLASIKFISSKLQEYDDIDRKNNDLDENGNLMRSTYKQKIADIFNEFNKSRVFSWRALDTFFRGVTFDVPKLLDVNRGMGQPKYNGRDIVNSKGEKYVLKGFNKVSVFSGIQEWCHLDYNSINLPIKY